MIHTTAKPSAPAEACAPEAPKPIIPLVTCLANQDVSWPEMREALGTEWKDNVALWDLIHQLQDEGVISVNYTNSRLRLTDKGVQTFWNDLDSPTRLAQSVRPSLRKAQLASAAALDVASQWTRAHPHFGTDCVPRTVAALYTLADGGLPIERGYTPRHPEREDCGRQALEIYEAERPAYLNGNTRTPIGFLSRACGIALGYSFDSERPLRVSMSNSNDNWLAIRHIESALCTTSDGPDFIKEIARSVRDVFGNPFRPVSFDPGWRSSNVVGLARAVYEDNDFSRLPVLADALEEAGCDHPEVLHHCRKTTVSRRGCWVVDLVLGLC